ncbi:hypothetical protein BR93DRAFT_921856 [Coniochaeta sp. PMI_546]|nr:hypothetical protein BR93DRAFT_921856 [Coniochaeta sp. PMI_546]
MADSGRVHDLSGFHLHFPFGIWVSWLWGWACNRAVLLPVSSNTSRKPAPILGLDMQAIHSPALSDSGSHLLHNTPNTRMAARRSQMAVSRLKTLGQT